LEFVQQNIVMSNPKNQCKIGWAKISTKGKVIESSSLKKDQKFILEDEFTKIEALCIGKD